jgi:hypothetical protein
MGRAIYSYLSKRTHSEKKIGNQDDDTDINIRMESNSNRPPECDLKPNDVLKTSILPDQNPSMGITVVLNDEYRTLGLRHMVLPTAISPQYLDRLLPLIMVSFASGP